MQDQGISDNSVQNKQAKKPVENREKDSNSRNVLDGLAPGGLVEVVAGPHKGARGRIAEVPGTLNRHYRIHGIPGVAFRAAELRRRTLPIRRPTWQLWGIAALAVVGGALSWHFKDRVGFIISVVALILVGCAALAHWLADPSE